MAEETEGMHGEIYRRTKDFICEIAGETERMHGEIYRRTKDFICEIAGKTKGMHGEIYRRTKDFICEIAGETEGMRREILVWTQNFAEETMGETDPFHLISEEKKEGPAASATGPFYHFFGFRELPSQTFSNTAAECILSTFASFRLKKPIDSGK